MGILEAIILGIVLSLDAFAVALSIGMCQNCFTSFNKYRFLLIVGVFHFIMPLIGWALAGSIHAVVETYDHWLAFLLLSYLGGKMIHEGVTKNTASEDREFCCSSLSSALMFGVALSIDAVIAGFSLGMTQISIVDGSQLHNILILSAIIGVCAFFITMFGLNTGRKASSKLGQKAEIFGGSVLIIIGLKTLITHLIT